MIPNEKGVAQTPQPGHPNVSAPTRTTDDSQATRLGDVGPREDE